MSFLSQEILGDTLDVLFPKVVRDAGVSFFLLLAGSDPILPCRLLMRWWMRCRSITAYDVMFNLGPEKETARRVWVPQVDNVRVTAGEFFQ